MCLHVWLQTALEDIQTQRLLEQLHFVVEI